MNCKACGDDLGHLNIFCRRCFALVPGKDRVELYAMFVRGQDTTSKVERCLRLIAKRRAKDKQAMPPPVRLNPDAVIRINCDE